MARIIKKDELLKDLIWLQSIIALEIIKISENMAEVTRGSETQKCREEHQKLLEKIVKILEKYFSDPLLNKHIKDHS